MGRTNLPDVNREHMFHSNKKFLPQPRSTNPHAAMVKPEELQNHPSVMKDDDVLRTMARRCTGMALATLAGICEKGQSENARVAAAKEILDRAWGKSGVMAEPESMKPHQQIKVVFGERPQITVEPNAEAETEILDND